MASLQNIIIATILHFSSKVPIVRIYICLIHACFLYWPDDQHSHPVHLVTMALSLSYCVKALCVHHTYIVQLLQVLQFRNSFRNCHFLSDCSNCCYVCSCCCHGVWCHMVTPGDTCCHVWSVVFGDSRCKMSLSSRMILCTRLFLSCAEIYLNLYM